MLNTILLLLSLLFLIFTPAIAQEWQWVRDDLLINPSGVQSFGSARIDLGDIDGDSWLDLVVLDSVGMRLYRNRGLNSLISFERRPDWEFDLKPDSSKLRRKNLSKQRRPFYKSSINYKLTENLSTFILLTSH